MAPCLIHCWRRNEHLSFSDTIHTNVTQSQSCNGRVIMPHQATVGEIKQCWDLSVCASICLPVPCPYLYNAAFMVMVALQLIRNSLLEVELTAQRGYTANGSGRNGDEGFTEAFDRLLHHRYAPIEMPLAGGILFRRKTLFLQRIVNDSTVLTMFSFRIACHFHVADSFICVCICCYACRFRSGERKATVSRLSVRLSVPYFSNVTVAMMNENI